jgi:hypothetical protein
MGQFTSAEQKGRTTPRGRWRSMKTLSVLILAGMLFLGLLGVAFKLLLGRYAVAFVLVIVGVNFLVTFLAFVFVILTIPPRTNRMDLEVVQKNAESERRTVSPWIN